MGIAYFVFRYKEDLHNLDIGAYEESKKRVETKSTILEERLKRKLFSHIVTTWNVVKPHIKIVGGLVKKGYTWIVAKEREYRSALEERKFKKTETVEEKEAVIEEKLEQVEEVIDVKEREHQLLEIISLDPKNAHAYEELAALYVDEKQYNDARDVYEFLVTLIPDDIDCYLDFSDVLYALESYQEAFDVLTTAHKRAPKNPKVIDRMTDIAILLKDKFQAKQSLRALQTVNPDNKKIAEFEQRITAL